MKKLEGKVVLNINIPVHAKKALLELAKEEDTTMTELIIRWIEENKKQ